MTPENARPIPAMQEARNMRSGCAEEKRVRLYESFGLLGRLVSMLIRHARMLLSREFLNIHRDVFLLEMGVNIVAVHESGGGR